MTVLAVFGGAQLVVIAGLVWFCARRETVHARTLLDLIETQDTERAQLLNRIQRPDFIVPARPNGASPPEPPKPSPHAKVGKVRPLRDPDPGESTP